MASRSSKPEHLRDSTDYIRLARAEAKRLKRATKLLKAPTPPPSVFEIASILDAADTPLPSNGRVRTWAEFELVFDYPASEREAVDTATKHLASTAVWVHFIRVLVPGVERVFGRGIQYTWKFQADVEFLPIDAPEMDAPTIYGVDGRALSSR